MELTKKFLLKLLPLVVSGCTVVPGSHLSLDNKAIIETEQDATVSDVVNLYPLTAHNVALFKTSPLIVAKSNPELDSQIAAYEYYIGPGDILNVTIWDHPELTIPAGSYRSSAETGNTVGSDGTIFYPYIGMVNVNGKTVRQVRQIITSRLKKFIESPQVDINVAAFRSKKVYITGEVNKPGRQPITNIPMTLLDAVNKAAGLAENADWRHVTLTRHGHEQIISLFALIQKGDLTQNRLLMPGDIVHVPRNDSQKVFVMGEVNEPKLLKIDRAGMTLTEALSSAGGINELEADATGVFVIRSSANKSKYLASIYQLDIKDASALVIGTEFNLQPYDIVYITASPVARWNRVIRQLLPTITGYNDLTEGSLRLRNWP